MTFKLNSSINVIYLCNNSKLFIISLFELNKFNIFWNQLVQVILKYTTILTSSMKKYHTGHNSNI